MSDPHTSEGIDLGSEAWDDLARTARPTENDDEQQEDLRQLLTFEVDSTPYAVPVERVREIVRIRPITPVPHVPKEVRGVISLRGEIVEVNAEVRIMPADAGISDFARQKPEIFPNHIKIRLPVWNGRIHAEVAGVWTTKTG